MKSAGAGIVIFGLAVRAHAEGGHGGVGAVVRNGRDNAVTGAAVGAVDKRIAITAVGGIKQFGQAIGADITVRGDLDVMVVFRGTGPDLKGTLPLGRDRLPDQAGDAGQGWQPLLETIQEFPLLRGQPFDFDQHPLAVVQHPAGQATSLRLAIDKRAETDPLDDPFDMQPCSGYGFVHCLSHRSADPRQLLPGQHVDSS